MQPGPLMFAVLVGFAVLFGFVALWRLLGKRDPMDVRLAELGDLSVAAEDEAGDRRLQRIEPSPGPSERVAT